MMSYLHTKFHDNWIGSFRGVAMTRFWDGRTDGMTALLDLLSPSATQVKKRSYSILLSEFHYFPPISFNNIVYFTRSLFPKDFKDQKAAAV